MQIRLQVELTKVSRRLSRLAMWRSLGTYWIVAAAVGVVVLAWNWWSGRPITSAGAWFSGGAAAAGVLIALGSAFSRRDLIEVARAVERRFPELNDKLLAAIEQSAAWPEPTLGFLQQQVVRQALDHNQSTPWTDLVDDQTLSRARAWHLSGLVLFLVACSAFMIAPKVVPPARMTVVSSEPLENYEATIEPGAVSIERGTDLLVTARFAGGLPPSATIVVTPKSGPAVQIPMSKSLDDPLFGGRIASVRTDGSYAVVYGNQRSEEFALTVFDYPDLVRADAQLTYPAYTKLTPRSIEDTRRIAAIEGTRVDLDFRFNKPLAKASLEAEGAAPIPIELADESTGKATITLTENRAYKLRLVDRDGRKNASDITIRFDVAPSKRPDIKVTFPGRDIDVSPLQEFALEATATDDFGIVATGMTFELAGKEQEVPLDQPSEAKKQTLKHEIALETLGAEPDQLVTYYFWADDVGPSGEVRRTSSDLFLAEVRRFEEIFREGESPAGGRQQRQQQDGQQQGNSPSQQLAETQKMIITSTWNLLQKAKQGGDAEPLKKDVAVVSEAQQNAIEQAAQLKSRAQGERQQELIDQATGEMEKALVELTKAVDNPIPANLDSARTPEQAAYQTLLKLRAVEHQVVRQQRQPGQQGGGGGGSSASERQLQELELSNRENRYENARSAQAQEQPADRERNQVLNRLRELARRQEDLNRRLAEAETSLAKAPTEQEREEIRRQLKRLREEQQEVLRDVDELRARMEQPENRERMAEAREQLDQTRENVRRSSEALEKGMVPEAVASGTRAERELNELRDDFRKQTARQFTEEMKSLRQDARKLASNQEELAKSLDSLDKASRRSLRDGGERKELTEKLGQQKQKLDGVIDTMKDVSQQSEVAEPLLSKQLYDTVRKAEQKKLSPALNDLAEKMVRRGFLAEANEAQKPINEGINDVRKGVERAAEGILGDELAALERARNEIDSLAEQLAREIESESGERIARGNAEEGENEEAEPKDAAGKDRDRARSAEGKEANKNADGGRSGQPKSGSQRKSASAKAGGQGKAGGRGEADSKENSNRDGEAGGEDADPKGERPSRSEQQGKAAGKGKAASKSGGQGKAQGKAGGSGQGNDAEGNEPESDSPPSDSERSDNQAQQKGSGRGTPKGTPKGQGGGGANRGERDGDPKDANNKQGGGARERSALTDAFRNQEGGATGPGNPITGPGYRDWSDRLRNVEEMVDDPELRNQAARIREEAQQVRIDNRRHSKAPNWELVRTSVYEPLVELQRRLDEAIARKDPKERAVPIDRDPVPRRFAEQVRKYYEKLGSE